MTLVEIARIYTDLVQVDDQIPASEYLAKDEVGVLRTKYHQMFMDKLQEDGIEFSDRFDAMYKAFDLLKKDGQFKIDQPVRQNTHQSGSPSREI